MKAPHYDAQIRFKIVKLLRMIVKKRRERERERIKVRFILRISHDIV